MELEAAAVSAGRVPNGYVFALDDLTPLLAAIVADLHGGTAPSLIAARFHLTVAGAVRGACRKARRATGGRSSSPVGCSPEKVPVPDAVATACALLGLDPMYVANEGRLVAFVPRGHADAVLEAMDAHPLGRAAVVIGECVAEHPGMVVARTGLGGTRIVDLPLGEQLPRIC